MRIVVISLSFLLLLPVISLTSLALKVINKKLKEKGACVLHIILEDKLQGGIEKNRKKKLFKYMPNGNTKSVASRKLGQYSPGSKKERLVLIIYPFLRARELTSLQPAIIIRT